MNKIPTQTENPKGLHQRYEIRKIVPHPRAGEQLGGIIFPEFESKSVDYGSEYFVMRLDTGGSDMIHINACRIGIQAYANAIEHHLPELAKDLRERYPPLFI